MHHSRLPNTSTLLAGRQPPDEIGFKSELLQIWYNHTDVSWADPRSHFHPHSDECFIVLRGELVVEVAGERHIIREREFCCFPRGSMHSVVETKPPLESLMIRAPSIDDKSYEAPASAEQRP